MHCRSRLVFIGAPQTLYICAPVALDNVRNTASLVQNTQLVVVLDIGRHTARWTSAQHRSDA